MFSVFVNKLTDRNKVFKLQLIKKIQCYVLELHLLGNTGVKCDFFRFFLSEATARKAMGSGLVDWL